MSLEKVPMKAHRVILAANSPVFDALFCNQCIHQDQLVILPYAATVISSFINFCYSGEISIEERNLSDFVSLCKQFACVSAIEQIEQAVDLINNKKLIEGIVKSDDFDKKPEESNVESIFFENFEDNEVMKEEYLNEAVAESEFDPKLIKYEEQESFGEEGVSNKPHIPEDIEKSKKFPIVKTIAKKPKVSAAAFNLASLKEEQEKFKKKLQDAINSCKNGQSIKKASKMFGVSVTAIERNLQGFKLNNFQ